jgi:hypothetical protein
MRYIKRSFAEVGRWAFHSFFAYYSPMGGERASISRMRLAGKICCACRVSLDPDPTHPNGERYCARCTPRRKVLMTFMLAKDGWSVSFLEEDCKTSLLCRFVFQNELKILDLARHGGAEFNLAGRQAIEHGIGMGRGSVWLKLTREQYSKLNAPRPI